MNPASQPGFFLAGINRCGTAKPVRCDAEKIAPAKPIPQSFHGFAGLTPGAISGLGIGLRRSFDRANKAHIFHDLSRQRIWPSRIIEALGRAAERRQKKDSRVSRKPAGKKNVKFPNQLGGAYR